MPSLVVEVFVLVIIVIVVIDSVVIVIVDRRDGSNAQATIGRVSNRNKLDRFWHSSKRKMHICGSVQRMHD